MGLRDTEWEGVEWIHLAQDRDQWRAVVFTVMYLRDYVDQLKDSANLSNWNSN
jgi:hypothetical protein